ncbi:MAG: hypothetical protein PHI66_03320 [Candidatus Pacebacteria bacterium]|nr:hypothetical protein [Candidatus Paceibacterota bacterium]
MAEVIYATCMEPLNTGRFILIAGHYQKVKRIIPHKSGFIPRQRGTYLHLAPTNKKPTFVKTAYAKVRWGDTITETKEVIPFYTVKIVGQLRRWTTHDGIRVGTIESYKEIPLKYLKEKGLDVSFAHIEYGQFVCTKIYVRDRKARRRIKTALQEEGYIFLKTRNKDCIKVQIKKKEITNLEEIVESFFYSIETIKEVFESTGRCRIKM